MTLAVLDTIGSMTENSILRSIQFNNRPPPAGLSGEGVDNAPQPTLPPTEYNLSRYVASFQDYQLDNGNVLAAAPNNVNDIFSLDYPPVQKE